MTAEAAVRAWVNGRLDLTGTQTAPGPLPLGAYLTAPRSPSSSAIRVETRWASDRIPR